MMTIIVLWILLGIIAVIVILLHFSVSAEVNLDKAGFDLKIRYMFFNIYPRRPKKKKRSKQNDKDLQKNVENDKPHDDFSFDEFEDDLDDDFESISDDNVCKEEVVKDDLPDKKDEENLISFADNDAPETINEDKASEKEPIFSQKKEYHDNENQAKTKEKRSFFKRKDKNKNAEKSKKSGKLDELKEKYALIKPYIPTGWKYFKKMLKAIRITDTEINLTVGKEDAYEAALFYGKIQGGLFNLLAVISGIFTVKINEANVRCAFNEKRFDYSLHTVIRVRPSALIAICFCVAVNFLRIFLPDYIRKRRAARKKRRELEKKFKASAENKTVDNLS